MEGQANVRPLRSEPDALAVVRLNGLRLQDLGSWRAHRLVALQAVHENGLALRYVAPELLDEELVGVAVAENPMALRYAGALQANREALRPLSSTCQLQVVLRAVRRNGTALHLASEQLKDDAVVALIAVRQAGVALGACRRLRHHPAVARAAVQEDGMALRFAGRLSRSAGHGLGKREGDDRALVRMAVLENSHAVRYASPRLQADPEFAAASFTASRSSERARQLSDEGSSWGSEPLGASNRYSNGELEPFHGREAAFK